MLRNEEGTMGLPVRSIAIVLGLMLAAMAIFLPVKDAEAATGLPVTGQLQDGGSFEGTVSNLQASTDDAGNLLISGVLNGTATTADGQTTQITDQAFTTTATLQQGGSCDILFLDLGPIHLDLLGLTVDLSKITLDVNAVPGAGNLLGNLLCQITGLLDNSGSTSQIANLLNQIFNLLG
ncbi:MAG TPA: hypothetical protein VFI90_17805 [Rubrobacter sp.]|nr:hypothetical protein [Rubrobacter sp.]